MFEKFAEDVNRRYQEKLAAIKEANALRDAVRLGRISPETFKELRQSKKYLPFEQYQNMKGLDKATYFQSLMKDLKSKLRGKGKNGAPSQYDNFMKNDFKGDFTEDQYNKLFGYQTEFPSLGRMARGAIKGVHNRVEDINKKIKIYNRDKESRDQLPTIDLSSSNYRTAKEVDDPRALSSGPNTSHNSDYTKLMVTVPSVQIEDNWDGTTNRVYDLLEGARDENLMEAIPSIYNKPGNNIAERALILQHEFDEALNMLRQQKHLHHIPGKDINNILHDSHASANVIGNEFLNANALFGGLLNNAQGILRASRSVPTGGPLGNNALNNNLSAQAIGIDYSKRDGGLSGRFKNMKDFKKYLKQVQKKDIKLLQDPYDYAQYVNTHRLAPERLSETDLANVAEATRKYFPNWDLEVSPDKIKNYIERLRQGIIQNNPANENKRDFDFYLERYLNNLIDKNTI